MADIHANETRPRRRLKTAIVGGGMIAEVHRRSALLSGADLVGVLSSTALSTRRVADDWGTVGYTDYEQVLSSDADVIHICAPNATHLDYTLLALAAGKHVVCEKPLGLTVQEAVAMDEAARRSGLVTTVPFVYRYHPMVREIRARLRAGDLGALNHIHGTYLQDWMLDPNVGGWRVDRKLGGASRAFADIGSHWTDLIEWVTGERFAAVSAATSIVHPTRPDTMAHAFAAVGDDSPQRPVETEDVAVAIFRTESGILANCTISQVAAGRKNRLWFELDGAKASAVFDQEKPESAWFGGARESRIVVRDPGNAAPDSARLSTLPAGHAQGYQQCFDNFVADTYATIQGETREGLPTFADGLRTSRIVDSVLQSAETGTWTPIS